MSGCTHQVIICITIYNGACARSVGTNSIQFRTQSHLWYGAPKVPFVHIAFQSQVLCTSRRRNTTVNNACMSLHVSVCHRYNNLVYIIFQANNAELKVNHLKSFCVCNSGIDKLEWLLAARISTQAPSSNFWQNPISLAIGNWKNASRNN